MQKVKRDLKNMKSDAKEYIEEYKEGKRSISEDFGHLREQLVTEFKRLKSEYYRKNKQKEEEEMTDKPYKKPQPLYKRGIRGLWKVINGESTSSEDDDDI